MRGFFIFEKKNKVGIVKKQAILGTIFTFSGAVLGFITTGILFPKHLSTEQIGLISVLAAYSIIGGQVFGLGFNVATTRMFSYFRNKNKNHHGFLLLIFIVSLVGFGLSVAAFFIFRPLLVENKIDESNLLAQFFIFIIPLLFSNIFFASIDTYYKVLYNAVIGTFSKEIIQRVFILLSLIFYIVNAVTFTEFLVIYTLAYFIPIILLIVSLVKRNEFSLKQDFSFLDKKMILTLMSVSAFGIVSSATGIITLNIDRIMIERMLGLNMTGVYTITFFYGTLVILPSRPLLKISSVFIADAWKNNDTNKLKALYQESSIHLLLIGTLILIGLWVNIHNIYEILDSKFLPGRNVIIIIGMAYLLDMALGINNSLVANSRKYRYNALFKSLLAVLIILFNWILIPKYGIIGAAVASAMAKFIENLIRYLFVWRAFNMQPFRFKTLLILIIGIVSYFAGYLLPVDVAYYYDILLRSGVVLIVFGILTILLKISKSINDSLKNIWQKLGIT